MGIEARPRRGSPLWMFEALRREFAPDEEELRTDIALLDQTIESLIGTVASLTEAHENCMSTEEGNFAGDRALDDAGQALALAEHNLKKLKNRRSMLQEQLMVLQERASKTGRQA